MLKHKRVGSSIQDAINYRISQDLYTHNWLVKKLQTRRQEIGRDSKEMDNNTGSNKYKNIKTYSLPVSIPKKYLKKSTEEKLNKMNAERDLNNRILPLTEDSNSDNDKSCETNKRKYDDEIANKLKKMRAIYEEVNQFPKRSLNYTICNKPDLILASLKPAQEAQTGQIKPSETSPKCHHYQLPIESAEKSFSNEPIRHRLPSIIQPERSRYVNRGNVNNNKDLDGINLKRRYQSAFTVFKDVGTNTSSFDARTFEMLVMIENSHLTLDTLKEMIKKKNTIEQGSNTDSMIEILNIHEQDNDTILVISDGNNSSDSTEMNDINNNGDNMINTQTNPVVDTDSDDNNTKILDHNIFKIIVAQSNRNKMLLNELCSTIIKIANDVSCKNDLNPKNNKDSNKADSAVINTDISKVNTRMPNELVTETVLTLAKTNTDNTQSTERIDIPAISKTITTTQKTINSSNEELLEDLPNTQNIFITESENILNTAGNATITTTSSEINKANEANEININDKDICNEGNLQSAHLESIQNVNSETIVSHIIDSATTTIPEGTSNTQNSENVELDEKITNISNALTVIKVGNEKFAAKVAKITNKTEISNVSSIINLDKSTVVNSDKDAGNVNMSTRPLNSSNMENEFNEINTNKKSQEEWSGKERLMKLLVNILEKLLEDSGSKQELNIMDSISQTCKKILTHTTTETPAANTPIAQNGTAVQSVPLAIETYNSTKSLSSKLTTHQSSGSSSGPTISQKAYERVNGRNYSTAKIYANNHRSHTPMNSHRKSPGFSQTMQPPASVAPQAIPRRKPPIDQRYQQTQQYKQTISHEHRYGTQTVAQTVTSELINNDVHRTMQDPQMLMQTSSSQSVSCQSAINPGLGMIASNNYGVQHRPAYRDVRIHNSWQSLPNSFIPYNQTDQIRFQVPNTQIDYRNTPAPVIHQRVDVDNAKRYQQLEQQQAAWTSQLGNYPNSNWSHTIRHPHPT